MQALTNLTLFFLQIRVWSASAKAVAEAIPGLSSIPAEVLKKGAGVLLPASETARMNSIRRRAQEVCLRYGMKIALLGCYGVPANRQDLVNALAAELEQARADFQAAVSDFILRVPVALDEWVENPHVAPFEHIIRAHMPPAEKLGELFSFGYSAIPVGAAEAVPVAAQQDTTEMTKSLGQTLAKELADQAKETADRLFSKVQGVPSSELTVLPKTVDRLRRLKEKLAGLAFVDSRLQPVVAEANRVFGSLPSGPLKGDAAMEFVRLFAIFRSPDALLAFGEGLHSVKAAQLDLDLEPAPVAVPVDVEQPEPTPEPEVTDDFGFGTPEADFDFGFEDEGEFAMEDDLIAPMPALSQEAIGF